MARVLAEQLEPVLDRIAARGMCQLVNKALDSERGVGRSDSTPPLHRNSHLGGMQFDADVGDRIRQVARALDRGRIDSVPDHRRLERRARTN